MKKYTNVLLFCLVILFAGCAETQIKNSPSKTASTPNHSNLLARVTTYWAHGKGADYNTRKHNGSWIGYGRLRDGHCAVDPKKIPYGSRIIYPNGATDLAVDTGRDVINRKAARKAGRTLEEKKALVIDKFFETRAQALDWARNHPLFVSVKVVPPDSF